MNLNIKTLKHGCRFAAAACFYLDFDCLTDLLNSVAASAAAMTVIVVACAERSVSAEAEQEDKGNDYKPNGGIVKKIAKTVHIIHPFR